jgi:hypothetical protein
MLAGRHVVHLGEGPRTGAEEAVARDVLAAGDALEQERVGRALAHAQISNDWRHKVGRQRQEDGHHVALGPVGR